MNVLVYAFRSDTDDHAQYAQWLQAVMTGREPVGISELVLSGVIRLATNHRVFRQPSTTAEAFEFCRAMRSAPAAIPLRPGPRHWDIFTELCGASAATANDVPDAYHAALALEHGATWVTNDRGYARFPDLRWRGPFEER